jgi:hypothetical protein
LAKACAAWLVLHDGGGLADVRQVTQAGSARHACSCVQHDPLRQVSHVGSPDVNPHPTPPLLLEAAWLLLEAAWLLDVAWLLELEVWPLELAVEVVVPPDPPPPLPPPLPPVLVLLVAPVPWLVWPLPALQAAEKRDRATSVRTR